MATRPINGDTRIDLIELINLKLTPLVERYEHLGNAVSELRSEIQQNRADTARLEAAVGKLTAEVHDSNSKTTAAPSFERSIVLPMNQHTVTVAKILAGITVVVVLALIMGLVGQGDKIPQVVGSHLPGAVPSGE